MQLAIPSAPRPVGLHQVPGALARVGAVAAAAALVTALGWWGGATAQRALSHERAFLDVAEEVTGQVTEVVLPDEGATLEKPARLRVIYRVAGRDYAASGVLLERDAASALGLGARLTLLVDPAAPSKARAAQYVRGREPYVWLSTAALGVGVLLGVAVVALELRRAVRRELAPLKVGALVWLTPDAPLPDTKAELRFPAHYFRDDVKHEVTARGRPGRRPVRNGEKVLAAVVPGEPTWVRVIDEDLARTLGWYR